MTLSRRRFLVRGLGLAAAVALPRELAGAIGPRRSRHAAVRPIRIRGRVMSGGKGLARVSVSDGLQVVPTTADGSFDLVTDRARRYVMVTTPAGYRIPTQAAGTFKTFGRIPQTGPDEADLRVDLVPLLESDERHAFLVLADTQTQDQADLTRLLKETVPDVQATVQSLGDRPLFGVANGDILWDDLSMYGEYERAVTAMGIPFAQVVGNHDLDLTAASDEASTATFERHFGPRFYSFKRGRIHYVVLDDVFYYSGGYLGYLPEEQLSWLAADLALVEPGSQVVVFLHIPLMRTQYEGTDRSPAQLSNTVSNRAALVRLLEPFRARVISGHTHVMDHRTEGQVVEHNLAAVCGGWWTGDLCSDGAPNGYAVYEVEGEDLRWRYQATGKPADHQVRAYPRGADPAAAGQVVANVWDARPGWTVTWYEGGDRRGAMEPRTGLDPRAVRLLSGPDQPAKRGWVDPSPTAHLYYAATSGTVGDVIVEAVDPWGRRYTARPESP